MYHPFPLGIYFNCFGNESLLADCRATGTLLSVCNFENIAGVQCAGEMVTGTVNDSIQCKNHYCGVDVPRQLLYIIDMYCSL